MNYSLRLFILYSLALLLFCNPYTHTTLLAQELNVDTSSSHFDKNDSQVKQPKAGVLNEINPDEFAHLIFDWRSGEDFAYLGDRPAIVDFYATWCVPCHLLRSRLKEVAEIFKDEIYVFSIDAETAPNLSYLMGVQAYPTLLFIPMKETPFISAGLLSKEDLIRGVNEYLFHSKVSDK